MINKTILVTGGAGFIGSNYIKYVLQASNTVKIINLDALTYAGNSENLKGIDNSIKYEFINGNIIDSELLESLFKKYNFDAVINFAAETHVDRSIDGPKEFVQTNIVGTFELLETARNYLNNNPTKKDTFRFHHISTDEVYGSLNPTEHPFLESTPYAPTSPYSASKAASDHLVRSYFHAYQLPILITNCSNNYGPYQYPEKLIPLMILNALSEKPLPIYGDGMQVRDWLYVGDHCNALWKVLANGEIGETYNIGGGNQFSNIEIVEHVCSYLDKVRPRKIGQKYRKLIEFVQDRPGHDRRYDVNFGKITEKLNWMPTESLETGLEKTIQWYLENISWVKKVTNNSEFRGWLGKNYVQRENSK
jgi:dTDP-glucose 4,6-dehydratase